MKYLSVRQILMLHDALIQTSGGSNGLRDESLLDSAVFAPIQTFDGKDLYPTLIDKVSRLAFGLITNHPFLDGNKRIGTHAMLVLLAINGLELEYNDEDLIEVILQLAAGELSEVLLHQWIAEHIK